MSTTGYRSDGSVDLRDAVEIADRLWWVGCHFEEDHFQCHTYLLEAGDESVLFDPGSMLGWETTHRKIEQIVPLSSVKWVVCHHQDPDITAALPAFEKASGRSDVRLVTHWRAAALLKHMGLDMEFWNVEEHDWRLELGGRRLSFIPTPYLHFAGAFCTFDEDSGTLLSSDLCGGFTSEPGLYMEDISDLDGIEAFHEHYMPSRDILMNGILELERHPVKRIAPQHGRVIPEEFTAAVFNRLKTLDCGLFMLQAGQSGFEIMQVYNRVMRETMDSLTRERHFSASAAQLAKGLALVLPLESVSFLVPWDDDSLMELTAENLYHGEVSPGTRCSMMFGMTLARFEEEFGAGVSVLTTEQATGAGLCNRCGHKGLVMPLFSVVDGTVGGVALVHTREKVDLTPELAESLARISMPLAVSLEREMIRRRLENERDRIFERSIRDPLTGLYTRRYMDDVVSRLLVTNSRGAVSNVALLMLDIDHFKKVNDTFGHQVGDEVLQGLAGLLISGARETDMPVRYGGEEFAYFAVVRDEEEARGLAERLRTNLKDMEFEAATGVFSVTMSVGIALHADGEDLDGLLRRADKALYEAKNAGRDRVHTAPGPVPVLQ